MKWNGRPVKAYYPDWMFDLYYFLAGRLVCYILGHRRAEYIDICERCYSDLPNLND